MLAYQACLSKDWMAPVYAFFEPTPEIGYVDKHRSHLFKCSAKGCNKRIGRFLDKADARSTSNLCKHVKSCWGEEIFMEADWEKNAGEVREELSNLSRNQERLLHLFNEVAPRIKHTHIILTQKQR